MGIACERCRDRLGDYVEGLALPEERAEIDAHLATCAPCREVLAGYRRLPALLSRALRPPGRSRPARK